jgi:hypothetical protein
MASVRAQLLQAREVEQIQFCFDDFLEQKRVWIGLRRANTFERAVGGLLIAAGFMLGAGCCRASRRR